MSRVPIIERQRGLSRLGEIRIGGEKPERGVGRKLEAFRLTSQHKDIIENAASLYGGEVTPWQSPNGDAWQVYTERNALPVLIILGYSLNAVYEKWEGITKCVRRCDGHEEFISGGDCTCNAKDLEGKQACDIVTRLMVVLHETGTSLGWQLRTIGENANRELTGAMMVAEELARGRAFVPATLRLTQRRSVIDGQTVRFVVPVLDFNLSAEAQRALIGAAGSAGGPAVAAGVTPVRRQLAAGVTLAEGLEQAAASGERRSTNGRQAAPIPVVDDVPFGEPVPVGEDAEPDAEAKPPKPTKAQKDKLGVLVGHLRKAGHDPTLWAYAEYKREAVPDADGVVHWGPLQDSLSRSEASALIDRLEAFEQKVTA